MPKCPELRPYFRGKPREFCVSLRNRPRNTDDIRSTVKLLEHDCQFAMAVCEYANHPLQALRLSTKSNGIPVGMKTALSELVYGRIPTMGRYMSAMGRHML